MAPSKVHKALIKPRRIAIWFSLGYLIICSAYIYLSSKMAAGKSLNLAQMQNIETFKGIIFVVVTTGIIFAGLWILLHRVARDEAQLVAQQEELMRLQSQSLASVFASSVAHDINNTLTILNYYFTDFGEKSRDLNEATTRQAIQHALNDLADLVQRLLRVGTTSMPSSKVEMDMVQVIQETLKFIRKDHRFRHCTIRYEGEDTAPFTGNVASIRQLLLNLLLNSSRAIQKNGEILVRMEKGEKGIILEVHDNGPGIADAMKKQLFKPFSTDHHKGRGLGLMSVKFYTDLHNGRVKVKQSESLGGACFHFTFPQKEPSSK